MYSEAIVDKLIQHGASVDRLVNDPAVKETLAALDKYYFEHWKAAEVPEHRQMIWDEMRALGRLQQHFAQAVAAGQGEAARLKSAEIPRHQP